MVKFQQCAVGVLDTHDDPNMRFDEHGRSHYYTEYKAAEAEHVLPGIEGRRKLEELASRIREDGHRKPYDCIVGVSGGVDSTNVALLAKSLGLRPLAVHVDNGWNSELAVMNIEQIITRLDLDLRTHVIDWAEFRDLQLAYLRAGVIDIEVITDHAIFAMLYRMAGKLGIKHILSGTNIVTEFVMPPHWIYKKTDHVNIRAIHKAHGSLQLKSYPFMDFKVKKWHQLVGHVRSHSVLNMTDFNKAEAKMRIAVELGWRDYGGKHFESIFTRFYQGYILPEKFGVDKRRAHLSNLIYSGQITKDSALEELSKSPYPSEMVSEDRDFVIKKLGLTSAEFDAIMRAPPKRHEAYRVERPIYQDYPILKPLKAPVDILKGWIAG